MGIRTLSVNANLALLKLFVTGFVIAMTLISVNRIDAHPQGEMEMVETLGPSPELFREDAIETALIGWQWKSELSRKQQELVLDSARGWKTRKAEARERMDSLRVELASVDIPFPVDSRISEMIEKEINELNAHVTGLSAEFEKLSVVVGQQREKSVLEIRSRQNKGELLKQQLELVLSEYSKTEQLYEKSLVPKSDLKRVRGQIAKIENEVELNRLHLESVAKSPEGSMAGAVAAVSGQLKDATDRLEELMKAKETIQRTDAIRKVAHLKTEIAFADRMVEMAHTRQFELALENTRYDALIQLAKERQLERSEEEADEESDEGVKERAVPDEENSFASPIIEDGRKNDRR